MVSESSLLVELVSLVAVEDEELVPPIAGEHLQSAVTQEVATLVHLPHDRVRPLHTTDGNLERSLQYYIHVYTCMITEIMTIESVQLQRVLVGPHQCSMLVM